MKRFKKQQGQVLIILVTTLFLTGGAGTAGKAGWIAMGMTVDTLEARIDKAVFDPERRTRIIELADQWKNEVDAFLEMNAGRKKALLELVARHDSTPDEFRALTDELDVRINKMKEVVINTRFAMCELMSRSEWESVFEDN